jgi:hypothetical protein
MADCWLCSGRLRMTDQLESEFDYDARLQANLARVFNEHDAERRMIAIGDLYAADAILFEPDGVATGHAAINAAVTALLSSLPPGLAFTATGPALGHHDLGRLRWTSGPPGGLPVVSGMDIARFEAGLIQTIHVFIEPGGA